MPDGLFMVLITGGSTTMSLPLPSFLSWPSLPSKRESFPQQVWKAQESGAAEQPIRRGSGAAVMQERERDGRNTGWAVPESLGKAEQLRGEGSGAAVMQEGERDGKDTGWTVPEKSGAAVVRKGGSGAAVMHLCEHE